MNPDDVLDLTGLKCPLPAIKTKRHLRTMRAGTVLKVICDDPLAAIDIPFLLQQLGHIQISSSSDDDQLIFWISVQEAAAANEKTWPAA